MIGGFEEGSSAMVCTYDAIGSFERVAVASQGTGRSLMQPILDRSFSCSDRFTVETNKEESIRKLVEAYRSVAEREIGVGDEVTIVVLERGQEEGRNAMITESISTDVRTFPLKQH